MLNDLAEVYTKAGDELLAKSLLDVIEPVWSGSYAYRGIFPKEKLAAVNPDHRALVRPINVSSTHIPVYVKLIGFFIHL